MSMQSSYKLHRKPQRAKSYIAIKSILISRVPLCNYGYFLRSGTYLHFSTVPFADVMSLVNEAEGLNELSFFGYFVRFRKDFKRLGARNGAGD